MFLLITLVLIVYLWLVLVRVMHEFARCVVARLGGLVPDTIYIGVGRPFLRHRLGDVEIAWALFPYSSRTVLLSRPDQPLFTPFLLSTLAGPVMDFALLLLLPALADFHQETFAGFFRNTSPLEVAFPFHLVVAVANLIPISTIRHPGDDVPVSCTDGQWIMALWKWKSDGGDPAAIEAYCKSIRRYDPEFQWQDARCTTDLRPERRRHTRAIDRALVENRLADAFRLRRQELAEHPFAPGERALTLDQLASMPVFQDAPGLLDEAIECAKEAHEMFPESTTVHGTYGSLLVLAEKPSEGIALLEPLTSPENAPPDRIIAAAFLALAHHLLSDPLESRYWLTMARENLESLQGDPAAHSLQMVLQRMTRRIEPSPEPGTPQA